MKEPRPKPETGSREKSVRPSTSPEHAPTRAVSKDISSRLQGASFGDLLRRRLYVRSVERSRRGRFDGP
jgi:hypothetical protein